MRRVLVLFMLTGLVIACNTLKPAEYADKLKACEAKPTACEYVACCKETALALGRDPAKACALELCP